MIFILIISNLLIYHLLPLIANLEDDRLLAIDFILLEKSTVSTLYITNRLYQYNRVLFANSFCPLKTSIT